MQIYAKYVFTKNVSSHIDTKPRVYINLPRIVCLSLKILNIIRGHYHEDEWCETEEIIFNEKQFWLVELLLQISKI